MSDINHDIAEIESATTELQNSSDTLEKEGAALLQQLQVDFADNDKEFVSMLEDVVKINDADVEN